MFSVGENKNKNIFKKSYEFEFFRALFILRKFPWNWFHEKKCYTYLFSALAPHWCSFLSRERSSSLATINMVLPASLVKQLRATEIFEDDLGLEAAMEEDLDAVATVLCWHHLGARALGTSIRFSKRLSTLIQFLWTTRNPGSSSPQCFSHRRSWT